MSLISYKIVFNPFYVLENIVAKLHYPSWVGVGKKNHGLTDFPLDVVLGLDVVT